MKNWPKIRGISRLEYASVPPGWRARYTRDGVTFTEDFYDSKFASPEAALEEAKKWHEQARTLLPPLDRREYAQLKRVTNKSGHVGVMRSPKHRKGHTYWSWVATWTLMDGTRKYKPFGVLKYGEEGAKKLAIEAREEALASMETEWPDDYWNYRRNLDAEATESSSKEDSPWDDIRGSEGDTKHREHLARERDRSLRNAKIKQFLEENGRIFCEVCEFCFEREYGVMGRGLIEIHHTLPVAQMEQGHMTRLKDLICICANCHLAVHNGDAYTNLQNLRFIYTAKKKKKSNKMLR